MPLRGELGEQHRNIVPISDVFIEKYMPNAVPFYVMVYLYGYSQYIKNNNQINRSQIAKKLQILESDVVGAWKYWQEQGIVQYEEKTDMVTFYELTEAAENTQKKTVPFYMAHGQKQPEYTPAELSVYMEKSNAVKSLFDSAQSYLGRFLSPKEMGTLFSFHDWLRLPMEVIEILLAYCTKNNHRNMNYIESVAIEWAENGIDTPQKAIERINLYSNGYMKVMKAFGQGSRYPSKTEQDFLKKWLEVYCMPVELLEEACDRTIMAVGKPQFTYMDGIVENWHKANVKTLEDIKSLDENYLLTKKAQQEQKKERKQTTSNETKRQNRFVNYEQRTWDFDEMERLEKEYIKRNFMNPK